MNYNGLEQRWKSLPQVDRERFALHAIHTACIAIQGIDQRRGHCPELTVANLAGDGENGFISLILQLMPDDLDVDLLEPIYIPNPFIDDILLDDDIYGSGRVDRQARNHLITMAVYLLFTEFVRLLLLSLYFMFTGAM